MPRKRQACAVAALWLLAACARPVDLGSPEPEPLPADEPMTEADVRAFLGVESEVRDFLEAEAAEVRAAEEADHITADGSTSSPLVDPADFDIPIQYNERVGFWIEFFRDRYPERFAEDLVRMGRYGPYVRSRLRARGMPEDLVYLALIESGFSPVARSRASAVGLWQFMAATGRRYGLEVSRYVDERRDPIRATEAALDYLQELHGRFGSWYLAAAAYNSGEGRVERALRRYAGGRRGDDALFWRIDGHLPRETRNYVPKLVAAAILAKYADRHGFSDVVPDEPVDFDVVTVPDATELGVIARAAGLDVSTISRLNPQFVRGMTPPGRSVHVRIPAGHAEAFATAYAKIPPSQRVRVLEHIVQPGETLSHVARRYGTTVRSLQESNSIRNPDAVRAGRRLIVRMGPAAGATAPAARRASASTTPGERQEPAAAVPAVYVVRAGDSLWSIARRYGVHVAELRSLNRLDDDNTIVPGQKLAIRPATRTIRYRVQPGDTIWGIARQHGITARELLEWNDLARDAVIRPGDEVEVPVTSR